VKVTTGLAACAALASLLAGCGGGTPADVAGSYTIAVTNGVNGCNLAAWVVGNSATNIGVTIAQDGGDATATIEGLTGAYVMVVLGSRVFTGEVRGAHLDLELIGTNPQTSGNCTYTYNAILDGSIAGDVIEGTITYTAATNDQSDCATIEACESVQDFNGTRPPSS
jgi:hypothetical protein